MEKTDIQFNEAKKTCADLFDKKLQDYGPSWRILRVSSLTDQIFIKAQRIRNIQMTGNQLVEDDVFSDFIGIANYSAMAILQIRLGNFIPESPNPDGLKELFRAILNESGELMKRKNHDYGEAWREMRVSSFTDLILMRIQRIRQIEDNQGITLVSEGIESNYFDIINYSLFALIKLTH